MIVYLKQLIISKNIYIFCKRPYIYTHARLYPHLMVDILEKYFILKCFEEINNILLKGVYDCLFKTTYIFCIHAYYNIQK